MEKLHTMINQHVERQLMDVINADKHPMLASIESTKDSDLWLAGMQNEWYSHFASHFVRGLFLFGLV